MFAKMPAPSCEVMVWLENDLCVFTHGRNEQTEETGSDWRRVTFISKTKIVSEKVPHEEGNLLVPSAGRSFPSTKVERQPALRGQIRLSTGNATSFEEAAKAFCRCVSRQESVNEVAEDT
jgi:hypothetical protein